MDQKMRFKGITIIKEDFESKYNIQLSDTQWNNLVLITSKSWEENSDELRLMVFKHVRAAMSNIGFKPKLVDDKLNFTETNE